MTVSLPDHPEVVAKPPLLFAIALASGFALEWIFPSSFVHGAARVVLGTVLLSAGTVVVTRGIRAQRGAGTNIETDRPTETIVSTSLYRYSRNPIYIGLVLIYLGVAALGDSLWLFALLVPLLAVMRYGVIAREEAYLERKFGDVYLAYRWRVRRWL